MLRNSVAFRATKAQKNRRGGDAQEITLVSGTFLFCYGVKRFSKRPALGDYAACEQQGAGSHTMWC